MKSKNKINNNPKKKEVNNNDLFVTNLGMEKSIISLFVCVLFTSSNYSSI